MHFQKDRHLPRSSHELARSRTSSPDLVRSRTISYDLARASKTSIGTIKKLKNSNFFKFDIFTKVKSPNIQNVPRAAKSLFLNRFSSKMDRSLEHTSEFQSHL